MIAAAAQLTPTSELVQDPAPSPEAERVRRRKERRRSRFARALAGQHTRAA